MARDLFRRQTNRRSRQSALGLLLAIGGLLAVMGEARVAVAATPTPTPTPPPANSPSNSFHVDQNAPIPWPIPATPVVPTAATAATLYAATPAHATDYPSVNATATAQLSTLSAPVGRLTTPVAQAIAAAPTTTGGDINLIGGYALYDVNTTFAANASQALGLFYAYIDAFTELAIYVPLVGSIMAILLITLVFGFGVRILATVGRIAMMLWTLIKTILALIGLWKPG